MQAICGSHFLPLAAPVTFKALDFVRFLDPKSLAGTVRNFCSSRCAIGSLSRAFAAAFRLAERVFGRLPSGHVDRDRCLQQEVNGYLQRDRLLLPAYPWMTGCLCGGGGERTGPRPVPPPDAGVPRMARATPETMGRPAPAYLKDTEGRIFLRPAAVGRNYPSAIDLEPTQKARM